MKGGTARRLCSAASQSLAHEECENRETLMKAGELIDLLMHYSDDDEIEVYEMISGCYVDTTADIAVVIGTCSPVFRIDVEAGKLRKPLR